MLIRSTRSMAIHDVGVVHAYAGKVLTNSLRPGPYLIDGGRDRNIFFLVRSVIWQRFINARMSPLRAMF
jgi:hypothetical protein